MTGPHGVETDEAHDPLITRRSKDMYGLICDPAWLQAIATVILVIITIIYVIQTGKLVHAPHTAFLKPEDIDLDYGKCLIKIKNLGPGAAVSMRVHARLLKKFEFAPTKKNPQRIFNFINWVEGKGASTISNGSTESYIFEGLISDLTPIKAEWKLITGKRSRDFWFYKTDYESKFLTNEGVEKITYYWNRLKEIVKSPYYRIQRMFYIRKRKKARKNET